MASLCFLTACGKSTTKVITEGDENLKVNREYSEDKMVTLGGTEVTVKDNENIFCDQVLGFGCVYSDNMLKMLNTNFFPTELDPDAFITTYYPQSLIEILSDQNTTQDEAIAAYKKAYNCFAVVRVTGDDSQTLDSLKDLFTDSKEIATLNSDTYYYLYNPQYTFDDMTDEDKANSSALSAEITDFSSNIVVFPAKSAVNSSAGSLTNFQTTDIDGNSIDQSIFANYDLTMVNVWATWCGPCLSELPEIQSMMSSLPQNVNIISVCSDASDDPDLTKQIIDSDGLTFSVLNSSDSLESSLLNNLTAFPSTVFVDKDGNIIGDVQVGVPSSTPAQSYFQMISERLAELSK